MRRSGFLLVVLLCAIQALGGPSRFNYQAKLKDPSGAPLTGDIGFVFSVFRDGDAVTTDSGTLVYSEVADYILTDGVVNHAVGSTGAGLTSAMFEYNGPMYLQVAVDGLVVLPRTRLESVPYALTANTATTIQGLGPVAFQPRLVSTIVVSPVGTPLQNGTSLLNAMQSITTNSATSPLLIKIEPGTYDLGTGMLVMKPYVDVEGSGEDVTTVTAAGSAGSTRCTILVGDNTELRMLTVANRGGNNYAAAAACAFDRGRITHVTAIASGGTTVSSALVLRNSRAIVAGSTLVAVGGGPQATALALGCERSLPLVKESTMSAFGGAVAVAVGNLESTTTLVNVTASAAGGSSASTGVSCTVNSGSAIVEIHHSRISAIGSHPYSIDNDLRVSTRIAYSQLVGPLNGSASITRVGCYDGNFLPVP
jgi:hypothetical protein